jgi:sugar/nucleoside kinase (ribokinase family)
MKRVGIAAAGNWIVDRVKTVDHWPEQDTLADILEETVGNGGGPFNLVVDLARMGAPFPLHGVGLVGNDSDGEWILSKCARHGILSGRLQKTDAPTSHTDVMSVKATGRRTFFHQRGANARFGPENARPDGLDAKIFYLGYLLLLDAMDVADPEFGTGAGRALAQARQVGMVTAVDAVSFDAGRYRETVLPTLPHVDWCFLNEFEAGRCVGLDLRPNGRLDGDAVGTSAARLFDAGVGRGIFLHAPEGAWVFVKGGGALWQPAVALPQAEIAGAVGAGDAFAAGALFGLHEERPLKDCLLWGVCAAAASLRAPSASEGVMSLPECLRLAESFGFRQDSL